MADSLGAAPPLPDDLLGKQLSAVELLQGMFCLDGEFLLLSEPAELDRLRSYLERSGSDEPDGRSSAVEETTGRKRQPPLNVRIRLRILIDEDVRYPLEVDVNVPLRGHVLPDATEPPEPSCVLRCPPWLDRRSHAQLAAGLPRSGLGEDSMLQVVEYLRQEAPAYISSAAASGTETAGDAVVGRGRGRDDDAHLCRVWFFFPSLSTRAKRDDLVDFAPEYRLTGFVLAGKPGLLCLEGAPTDVDAYMRHIKVHSWGDIPSHQKKVTERYREDPISNRAFADMQEITDHIQKRGARGNRGEMREVRDWMVAAGVGDAFGKVLGAEFAST